MEGKRNFLRSLLIQTPLKLIPSHGSYFECYSFGHITTESDREFAAKLIKECGVATIPVSAFYHDKRDEKVIRFCFAKKESSLEEAATRITTFFKELKLRK
jgi:methionine aminotransferase